MTLLAQTADRGPYFPGLSSAALTPTPSPYFASPGPTMRGISTASWGPMPPFYLVKEIGTVGRVTDRFDVWQSLPSWPINMALIGNMGLLVNPPAGSKRVSGVFQDQNGSPIARVGFLYDRSTGAFLGTFNSSGIDGSWNGYAPTVAPTFVVLIPTSGDSRNGVMLDNLVPVFP